MGGEAARWVEGREEEGGEEEGDARDYFGGEEGREEEGRELGASKAVAQAVAAMAGGLPPLKIYMYDLPDRFNVEPLNALMADTHAWGRFEESGGLEFGFHAYLNEQEENSRSVLVVDDPSEADMFYVPVYPSAVLQKAQPFVDPGMADGRNVEASKAALGVQAARNRAAQLVLDAMDVVEGEAAGGATGAAEAEAGWYWRRHGGRDHVIVLGSDHGLCLDHVAERGVANPLVRKLLARLKDSVVVSTDGDATTGCFNPLKVIYPFD